MGDVRQIISFLYLVPLFYMITAPYFLACKFAAFDSRGNKENWSIMSADVKGDANVLFFDRKPASETPWTKKLWIYDLRTNMHFTLKTNPLKREDLDEFVKCYNPKNRHDRKPTWSGSSSPSMEPLHSDVPVQQDDPNGRRQMACIRL